MALSPSSNKIGVIKQIISDDEFYADRLENYIDNLIKERYNGCKPFEFMIAWDIPSDKVISEVRKRYLNAGWQSFNHRYACDSRGDSYCYFELR